MRTLLGVLGVAIALFFAAPASADDAPNPELLRKQLLEKFDANGDGNLTGQESLSAHEAVMKQIGAAAGAAGQLNPQEQATAMAAFQNAGGLPGAGGGFGGDAATGEGKAHGREAMIKQFDNDGDGKLSDDEKAEAQKFFKDKKGECPAGKLAEAMKKFDTDGDGKISDDEKAAAKKELAEKRREKGKKPE